MKFLSRINSVKLHAQTSAPQRLDTCFKAGDSGLSFNLLILNGIVSIHLGIHNGEPWHRWIWMWESTQEADLALAQLNPGFEEDLEAVLSAIRQFVRGLPASEPDSKPPDTLDLTPHLDRLGLEMFAWEISQDESARELAKYKNLAAKDRSE